MQEFLKFIGHGFCHQVPSRSFEAGGLIFSTCARDTGIYLGFAFTILVAFILYARYEKKPGDLPPGKYVIVLILLLLPMALDGGTSYLGLRETTNAIRYITGFCAGIAAGSPVTPLIFAVRKDADLKQRIFTQPSLVVVHLLLTFALGAAFLVVYPYLGVIAPLVPVAAFLAIFFNVNLILVTLSDRLFPRHTLNHWLLLSVICLTLVFIEIAAFGALRDLVVLKVLNGHEFSEFLR